MADDDRPLPGRTQGTEDVHVRTFLIADVRGCHISKQGSSWVRRTLVEAA